MRTKKEIIEDALNRLSIDKVEIEGRLQFSQKEAEKLKKRIEKIDLEIECCKDDLKKLEH